LKSSSENGNGYQYRAIERRKEKMFRQAIRQGFFSEEEFERDFRGQFMDKYGQDSLACYLSYALQRANGSFVTVNPKLLQRRIDFESRFGLEIASIEEADAKPKGQKLMLDAIILVEMWLEKLIQKSARLASEGKHREAIVEASMGIQTDADNIALRAIRGVAYASTEQMEKAQEDLEFVLQRDETNPELLHNLGCVRFALGDLSGARLLFHRALLLRPDYELPKKMLAQMDES